MNNFIISFIITFIAGVSTLIGGFIPFLNIENKNKCLSIALAFAAGIMITISIFDLLPESFYYLVDKFDVGLVFLSIVLAMIMGIIVFVFLDKFLTTDVDKLYRIGLFSMIAIIVHNIPEGIITFILASNDIKLGLFMGLSIALHNIPEGISIMMPIYYGTGNLKKAFLFTLIAGLSEPIGGVLFYLLFKTYINNFIIGFLFAFVAGIMIYLSLCELLPKSLENKSSNLTLFWFMIGIIVFLLIGIFMH